MNDIEQSKNISDELKVCVIIPTYNNEQTLEKIVNDVLSYFTKVIVVNDGSTDGTTEILKKFANIELISYPANKGKGYALRLGFAKARELGFRYAITIDSDGQHLPQDIPAFLDAIKDNPDAILTGARNMEQRHIPGKSSFGHKFSNFWFLFETRKKIPDTQCGFRLYPLDLIKDIKFYTNKYEFEIEVLVRASWKGIKIVPVPVNVVYEPKEKRVSHFRPFTDFGRVSILNTIFVLIALFYVYPFHFVKNLTKENIKKFVKENVINSKDSNLRLALSVAVGVFFGIVPIWGWQIWVVMSIAFIFKLNKVVTFVSANISIPPMIPLILFLSYKAGGIALGRESSSIKYSFGINFETFKHSLVQYVIGSLCLATVLGICLGLIAYFVLVFVRPHGNIKTIKNK